MIFEEFSKRIADITADTELLDIHTSPDFQCDQTEGFPVSLCACWKKGKAWLELNESLIMDRDEMELNYYLQCCADFGIRSCVDEDDFNNLLRELGEEAVQNATIYAEDEGMGMQL